MKLIPEFLAGIAYLMRRAEELKIREQLVVIVQSEMGRTPNYNNGNGKDHWSIGSIMFLGRGIKGNRVIGATDEKQFARPARPADAGARQGEGHPRPPRAHPRRAARIRRHRRPPLQQEVPARRRRQGKAAGLLGLELLMDSYLPPERLESLQSSWVGLFERLGIEPVVAYPCFDGLVERYRESHRHYHNLEHIAEVLKVAGKLIGSASQPDAILLAGWYHDAIYDPRAKDNEEHSAELAIRELGSVGVRTELVDKTAALIRATAHTDEPADDIDSHILLDADLAILAAEDRRYQRYADDIRKEYAWVRDADYRTGRSQVLGNFLKRPRIYRTPLMFEVAETAARANMAAEIERLQSLE